MPMSASKRKLEGRPEYEPFARALHKAMKAKKLSASEVARRVWGSTKDSRGYSVAKNRDRIGHYLAGASYPEPENLAKLAEAVGATVDMLTVERPAPRAREPRQSNMVAIRPGMARIQIDCDGLRVVADVSAETVRAVMGLIVAKTQG